MALLVGSASAALLAALPVSPAFFVVLNWISVAVVSAVVSAVVWKARNVAMLTASLDCNVVVQFLS